MKQFKAKFKSSYVSKKGSRTFVFRVIGSEADLTAYLEAQAAGAKAAKRTEPPTDDDGTPLFWSTSPTGKEITVILTDDGKIFEDTSELHLNASMEANHDFAYGQVMTGLKTRAGVGAGSKITPNVNAENTPLEK